MLETDAIRSREAAATPGPWAAGRRALRPWEVCLSPALPLVELDNSDQGAADAEFIAYARDDVPALLREIDRLTAELARFEKRASP